MSKESMERSMTLSKYTSYLYFILTKREVKEDDIRNAVSAVYDIAFANGREQTDEEKMQEHINNLYAQ